MVINPILSYHTRYDYIGDDDDDDYDDDTDDADDDDDDDETIAVTCQVAVNLAPSLCLCQLTPHPQAAQYKVSTSGQCKVGYNMKYKQEQYKQCDTIPI